jgi:uncharacterized OB-fold protein
MIMEVNQNMIAQWRAHQSASLLDSQAGTILSWTKVCVAPEPFDTQVPYILVFVAVDNGQSILCQLADADESEIDFGVRVHFVTRITNCPLENSIITYGTKAMVIKK